jgi:hypothetical protein
MPPKFDRVVEESRLQRSGGVGTVHGHLVGIRIFGENVYPVHKN